jgi:hypothetical protein
LPNDSKVWRLAQSESDKLRAEPLTASRKKSKAPQYSAVASTTPDRIAV